jgi:hypothetical protein
VEAVPGTAFGIAFLPVTPTVFGPAIGSMVAGIASILVGLFVFCLGLTTVTPLAAGAFTVTTALVGAAAVVVGLLAIRHIARSAGALRGRPLAITGIACGGSGLGIGLFGLLLAIATG